MPINYLPRLLTRTAGVVVGMTGIFLAMSMSASADGRQCAPRAIAQNIKDAVLALKATEYCKSEDLPYTAADAAARIETLRCGPQSSELIDELLNNYEQEYKTILARDVRHVVCLQAASISLED